LAYNAYLLKESGKDEWQQSWPFTFVSFGDYKLPGYVYTLIPFLAVFGASDFTVRLPSVLAGTGSIVIIYLISRELFNREDTYNGYALLTAVISAVLPVSIYYSRMAWEANLGLVLSLSSIWLLFFKKADTGKKRLLTDGLGIIFALVASLTYNTPLLYLPFLTLLLLISRGIKHWKKWLPAALSLMLIFTGNYLLLSSITLQKSAITIFTDATVWANYVDYRQNLTGLSQKLIGSQYAYWLQLMAQNMISSFSPKFLINSGGSHPWHNIPGHSHLYWSIYIFGWLGIGSILLKFLKGLITKNKTNSCEVILLYLFLMGLAPAIVTVDAPHATRSLLFLFLWSLMSIIGLRQIVSWLKFKRFFVTIFVLLLILETSLYLKKYFVDYPQRQQALKPGFDSKIQQVYASHPNQQIAVVADGYQYILAAWYLKLEPKTYFSTVVRQEPDTIGLLYGERVGRLHFIAERQDCSEEDLLMFYDTQEGLWKLEKIK
jgi:4-amino-4-deoxy-L-arabinose transferase-like glycosyltransferase